MTELIAKIYKIDKLTLNRIIFSNTLDYTYLGEPLIILEDNFEFHSNFMDYRDNLWITSNQGLVRIINIESLNNMENRIINNLQIVGNEDQIILEKVLEIFDTICEKLNDDDILVYVWKKIDLISF
jgi:hypothetical protein